MPAAVPASGMHGHELVLVGVRCDECGGEGSIPAGRGRRRHPRCCPICRGEGELTAQLTLAEFRELAGPCSR